MDGEISARAAVTPAPDSGEGGLHGEPIPPLEKKDLPEMLEAS